ncbi:S9 family peptidase [Marmoricola sp. Leaf446]|uniref:alpha/beta hydrolase family protein n=1 Tax=Marmoricola sp. Leaf446 TaxID=1736379 RepID=UPI0009EAF9D8|nr:alpha/beta fold hydrolase [Marmoricola sp. Leaf446]
MSASVTRRTALLGAAGLTLSACAGAEDPAASPSPSRTPSGSGSPSGSPSGTPGGTPGASPSASATADALPPVERRVSLPQLMREEFDGGPVTRVRRQAVTDAYERWEVTYPAGDTTVSGILLRPLGRGPFPAVVLNHGYIEPSVYVTGQGLAREQDYLARAGFVVLHTDYRGHAASDPAGDLERESRLGYTRDTLHAVATLKRLPAVDPDRVGMLGRSMGGGVTLNALVAQPGAVRAAVVYASVSSAFTENLDQFTIPNRPEAAQRLAQRFGSRRESPDFYAGLSSRTYFDRVTEPVLIHHGTADDTCPPPWSRRTHRLLRAADVDSTLRLYAGEQHAFVPQWPLSMERTVRFLRRRLRA